MSGNKRYTDVYFKKRVDHEAGHARDRRIGEPAICAECAAVYTKGRWTFEKDFLTADPFNKIKPQETICPACRQIETGEPAGFVYLEGGFLNEHKEEIENLLKNEAAKTVETNPLARIINFQNTKTGMTVTTTTEHLAQHLGRSLKKAFDGDVRYDFSHENKLARVYWQRD
jgi:NMD protein affecting ribosome stability and mRNA decay